MNHRISLSARVKYPVQLNNQPTEITTNQKNQAKPKMTPNKHPLPPKTSTKYPKERTLEDVMSKIKPQIK